MMIVGMIVKILGLLNRMLISRLLTDEGVGIYQMVMPTYLLLITLAQLGFPVAISKLISENNIYHKHQNRAIVLNAVRISIINSAILITILIFSAKFLAVNLLNDERTFLPLLALTIFIPLVSFTSILRGYLQGYKNMSIPSIAQLIEQVFRITSCVILIIILLPISVELAVVGIIISLSIGELSSLIYMLYKIKNKRPWNTFLFSRDERIIDDNLTKDILSISIPSTGSRLIGSIAHFFEPIIFSIALMSIGYSNLEVTNIYGQITGYTLNLLLVPSFFSFALSQPLLPIIAEAYAERNHTKISHYFNLSIFLSFIIGLLFTIIVSLYPNDLMKLFFNTTEGTRFLIYMAPLFIIFYFQQPISSTLHALNKTKHAVISTFIGSALKLLLIYTLTSRENINVHGLNIAIIANVYFVTLYDYYLLTKNIKINYNFRTIVQCILLGIFTVILGLIFKKVSLPYYISILVLTIVYLFILQVLNIGDFQKIRGQLFNHPHNK